MSPLRLLHVIHDFLPRYQAGSEIYALALGRELARRHHVTILCADYDPTRAHGEVIWRLQDGLPVVGLAKEDFIVYEDGQPREITNFYSFESATKAFERHRARSAKVSAC